MTTRPLPSERPSSLATRRGRAVEALPLILVALLAVGVVTVTFVIVHRTGLVAFSVTDTGPGIPREHLPHIFDRFYQVRATGQAGAGLGLAIARGLVEAHGSGLQVTSRPGEGTTFEFDLPRITPTVALAPKVVSGGRG